MRLAGRTSDLDSPLLFTFAQEARRLAERGVDLVSMEQGQLNFPTPPNVLAAVRRFLDDGQVLYTNVDGITELKDAIRAKFAEENGLHYAADEVFVGSGTSQILFNAFAVSLEPGDEVIVPTPAWTVFELGIVANGGTLVPLPTEQRQGFKMTPEQLDRTITGRTRWLVLNSPSNPTGAVYSAVELRALAAVLRRHPQVSVISDDLYEHQVYDGVRFVNLLNVAPDLRDRVLVVNGVAKTYGMTGWRIGYCAAPAAFLEAMKWYQAPATARPSHVGQIAAIEALTGPRDFLSDRRAQLQRRRDILVDGLNGIAGWSAAPSGGAFYVYAGCHGLIGATTRTGHQLRDDVDVARYLLSEAQVIAVPGTAFRLSPFVRFSFGAAEERIVEGVRRIAAATAGLHRKVA